ncbi:MAG: hydrogen peroxide-inducible genes activator [Dongiaceae bacterium]
MNGLPSLRQLRYLVALADHGHFARAADSCHVTQSTLSVGIQELETKLGAPLVERRGRRTLLTPLGDEIARRARALLADATDLVETARSGREPLTGTIQLGVIPTVSPYLLPRILPELRRRYPKLRLYLTEDQSDRIAAGLEEGRLDALLLALPYELPGAETMSLFDDPFVFACREDHPLANETLLPVERLADEPLLLLQDGHCLSDQAIAACRLADRRGRAPFAATSLPTLIQMVDNGLGVTLLPQLAIDAGAIEGTAIKGCSLAGNPPPGREIALAWRRGSPRGEEFRLLGEAIGSLAQPTGRAEIAQSRMDDRVSRA